MMFNTEILIAGIISNGMSNSKISKNRVNINAVQMEIVALVISPAHMRLFIDA